MDLEHLQHLLEELVKRESARPPRKPAGRLRRTFDRLVGGSLLLVGGSIGGIGTMYLLMRRLDDIGDLPAEQKPKAVMEMFAAMFDWVERRNKKLSIHCDDCDGWGFGYMLEDAVWHEATADAHIHFLCIPCVERRLGRMLTPDDFQKDLPINGPIFEAFRIAFVTATEHGDGRPQTH